jgi:hypothetical protein
MKEKILIWVDKYLIATMSIGGIFLFGFLIGNSLNIFYHGPAVSCGDGIVSTVKEGWTVTLHCWKT